MPVVRESCVYGVWRCLSLPLADSLESLVKDHKGVYQYRSLQTSDELTSGPKPIWGLPVMRSELMLRTRIANPRSGILGYANGGTASG